MIRRIAVLVPVLFVAVSCGGGSDADGGGGSGESWCDVVTASNAIDDEFDAVDPAVDGALEAVLNKVDKLSDRFRDSAPDEIKSQVEQYADANSELVGVFRDADYDVEQLDEEAVLSLLDGVEGIEADIDVFTVAECGVPLGPDDT